VPKEGESTINRETSNGLFSCHRKEKEAYKLLAASMQGEGWNWISSICFLP